MVTGVLTLVSCLQCIELTITMLYTWNYHNTMWTILQFFKIILSSKIYFHCKRSLFLGCFSVQDTSRYFCELHGGATRKSARNPNQGGRELCFQLLNLWSPLESLLIRRAPKHRRVPRVTGQKEPQSRQGPRGFRPVRPVWQKTGTLWKKEDLPPPGPRVTASPVAYRVPTQPRPPGPQAPAPQETCSRLPAANDNWASSR